ncbi:MAG TPA: hypothetical protein VM582_09700 [Candidatus Thermoplasmatota archaeon]|nr:hypothetical protein [Candidatus Thermoplasmatota archaeon]
MRAHQQAFRSARVENEVDKAIRFAAAHGEWPIDLSTAAGRALVRRPDSEELQRRWGDLVDSVLAP